MESGTALRLILSGVFDRFPWLRIVLGHMGEAIPFWLWRIDFMHSRRTKEGATKKFDLTPSAAISPLPPVEWNRMTCWNLVIKVAGIDNVMWAIDYPYQPTSPAVAFIKFSAALGSRQGESLLSERATDIPHCLGNEVNMQLCY